MNNKTTGTFISARRKELNLNQKQLADKLGVTDKAVSKWETGRSAPDISLLEPLAKELGVSVVEILQGEKVEEENFSAVSDKVVVKTMKKDKQKLRRSVTIAVSTVIMVIYLLMLSYPAYHYFTTIPINDVEAIEKAATEYVGKNHDGEGNMKIVKGVTKGRYHFFLLEGTNQGEKIVSLCMFETDDVYKDRISNTAGSIGRAYKPNWVEHHSSGVGSSEGLISFNVFYGYDMTDTEYSFYYRGVKYTVPIEDEIFLHPFIDIDNSWTVADIIYDD